MTKPTKIVVIGSNSFSGASFANYALEQGAEVIGMSRSQEANDCFLPYRWGKKKSAFRFYNYDLNNNLGEIMDVIRKERIGHVVNFAAQSMVGESWKHPEHWMQTNVVSTVRLHNQLRQCDFLDRYVHITTPEVYGSTEGFIKENTPYNPSTPYAVSRAAADMSLKTFFDAYKFPVVFTRAANVYGPGQQLYRIIPRTIMFLKTKRKLGLQGGGLSQRSFIHMGDVSDATWRVMVDGVPGETYHISTNEIVSIRNLVERICKRMNVDFEENVEVVGDRLGKDAAYKLDSSKIRETLGWNDRITLDSGLDNCLDWVEKRLVEMKDLPVDYVHKP